MSPLYIPGQLVDGLGSAGPIEEFNITFKESPGKVSVWSEASLYGKYKVDPP